MVSYPIGLVGVQCHACSVTCFCGIEVIWGGLRLQSSVMVAPLLPTAAPLPRGVCSPAQRPHTQPFP